MLQLVLTSVVHHWPFALVFFIIAKLVSNYLKHGLHKYPGPFPASLTDWWRFLDVLGRRPDITHIKLHREHGNIVRLGPKTLSFGDPRALRAIYGPNKGFIKAPISLPNTSCTTANNE